MILCSAFGTSALAEYSGKGGMAAYSIQPEVYLYHYKNGFTGPDAMGWDPNLQFAWSRAGAAKTCGIAIDKEKTIDNLIKHYGNPEKLSDFMERFSHDMNGIEFHHLQSKTISDFCTPERVNQIRTLIPKFENGNFPKPF